MGETKLIKAKNVEISAKYLYENYHRDNIPVNRENRPINSEQRALKGTFEISKSKILDILREEEIIVYNFVCRVPNIQLLKHLLSNAYNHHRSYDSEITLHLEIIRDL